MGRVDFSKKEAPLIELREVKSLIENCVQDDDKKAFNMRMRN